MFADARASSCATSSAFASASDSPVLLGHVPLCTVEIHAPRSWRSWDTATRGMPSSDGAGSTVGPVLPGGAGSEGEPRSASSSDEHADANAVAHARKRNEENA